MKKIFLSLFILFNCSLFSENISPEQYNFPLKNPYAATIIGSSTLMIKNIKTNTNRKVYELNLKDTKIPESLWYLDKYSFSLSAQKKKAPLIFILSGTGSNYDASRTRLFERIFYTAGYHVITVPSTTSSNFIVDGLDDKMPGALPFDTPALYSAMKASYERVKNKIDVSEFYVMGYSLGATHAAFVSYLDETGKYFNFKRAFMINPTVNLYTSAVLLDNLLDKNLNGNKANIQVILDNVISTLLEHSKTGTISLTEEAIFDIFKEEKLSNRDMEALIGLAFRIVSINLNYLTDLINDMGVYVEDPKNIGKFTNLFPYFQKVDFATFDDYLNKIAYPYFKKHLSNKITPESLIKMTDMSLIQDYLATSPKLAVVTNADELILTPENLKYLETTFKDRLLVYPYGGHCGNMYFKSNVATMLNFLENGVLKYEN
jgi:predicted alpha/beta-fold hydrolase